MELTYLEKRDIAMRLREVFTDLTNLTRWTLLTNDDRFTQLGKLAMQSIITFCIANMAERSGLEINWNYFPKLAIRAAALKYKAANTSNEEAEWIKSNMLPNVDILEEAVKQTFDGLHPDVIKMMDVPKDTVEADIYGLAGKLASQIELQRLIYPKSMRQEYRSAAQSKKTEIKELKRKLKEIKNLSFHYRRCRKVLIGISFRLSNQSRWMMQSRTQSCSVSGHSFDTAVLSYVEALEKGYGEDLATRCFFLGLFHDVAETWTMDMPSPFKDSIPGLRMATEAYEQLKMEKKMYSRLPHYLVEAIKEVDFSSKENEVFYPLVKGADSLSAVSECYRQYLRGTRDPRFKDAADEVEVKYNTGCIELTDIGRYLLINTIADMRW